MFLMCAEEYKTSFSVFNLGVASYNLGEFDEAEKVLSLSNYMDPTHAPTWAYITLTLLKKPDPPLFAAYQSMNESVKLGLSDSTVMYEIACSWIDQSSYKASKEAFEWTIQIMGQRMMPGQKAQKKIQECFMACNEILENRPDSVAELKQKLDGATAMIVSHKNCGTAIREAIDTYVQLLTGELVLKPGENDFLDG